MTEQDATLIEALEHYRRCLTSDYNGGEYPSIQSRFTPSPMDARMVAEIASAFPDAPLVRILDVGCGPVSNLGTIAPFGVEITGVDQYADEYAAMLAELGIAQPHRLIAGQARALCGLLPGEQFHIAYCHNALDHFEDPATTLAAMAGMLLPGGVIWIEVYEREGTANKWAGMHRWDFFIHEQGIIAEGSGGTPRLNICAILASLRVSGEIFRGEHRLIRLVGRKR